MDSLYDRLNWLIENVKVSVISQGCGKPTRVAGTNGGWMKCGAMLRELDGTEAQYLCAECEPNNSK